MHNAIRQGMIVSLILALLTILEYVFAVNVDDDTVRFLGLAASAVAKAALIVYYFMHIYRVWRTEGAH